MVLKAIGILFFFLLFMWLYSMSKAHAQVNHDHGHVNYQNWVNKADRGCCNNRDCGSLASENERETKAGTVEVKIDNEWCPVLPHHYLKRGNAPDWSTAHVCVQKYSADMMGSACVRLLCYQPRPSS